MLDYLHERDYERDFPYTDLAAERRRADTDVEGVFYEREPVTVGEWERIEITSDEGARSIGRPIGIYDTLNTLRLDLFDSETREDAAEEVRRELCYIFERSGILPRRILVAGLGNPKLTPDEIGTLAAGGVHPTLHIKERDPVFFEGLECSEIAVITPGVAAASGIEGTEAVRAVCDRIKPDAVIAIDALAARAPERLGTTVQICNTGITPGSGVGGRALSLTKETLGVPVIAIGVPTVIDSRMFWYDCSDKNGFHETSDLARRSMLVAPKEINEICEEAGKIIARGINEAFGILI